MYKRKIPLEFNCGLDLVKEVLFGKWKIHLIYFIAQGVQRPGELQRKIPGATRRVLNVQLNQLESHGIRPGLSTIRVLVEALGHPELAYRTIHVGGTNGKGSVTAMVEAALRVAGHRSARYTSTIEPNDEQNHIFRCLACL